MSPDVNLNKGVVETAPLDTVKNDLAVVSGVNSLSLSKVSLNRPPDVKKNSDWYAIYWINERTYNLGSLSRYRRNVYQFKGMIECATTKSAFAYNGYGCYCGMGGKGKPVDETDRFVCICVCVSVYV